MKLPDHANDFEVALAILDHVPTDLGAGQDYALATGRYVLDRDLLAAGRTRAEIDAMTPSARRSALRECATYWYGPAETPTEARILAHRYLDRQGGDPIHLRAALEKFAP